MRNPNSNDQSVFAIIGDAIYRLFSKVEHYFEDRFAAEIISKVILFLISITIIIIDVHSIVKQDWFPVFRSWFLAFIIILLLSFDMIHVSLAKKRDILSKKFQLDNINLRRIFWETAYRQPNNYKIIDWSILHNIDDNGNLDYKREMTIGCLDEIINWVKVPVGIINGLSEGITEHLNIKVTNPVDGSELPFVVIEDSSQKRTLAILLDPPASKGVVSKLCVTFQWEGAYSPLVKPPYKDVGRVTIENPTDNLSITFIVSAKFKFQSLSMFNNIGHYTIEDVYEQSRLKWIATNLIPGVYPYTLHIRPG
jgi:hypothetical protein